MKVSGNLLRIGDSVVGFENICPFCGERVYISVEDPLAFFLFKVPVLNACDHLLSIEVENAGTNRAVPFFIYEGDEEESHDKEI